MRIVIAPDSFKESLTAEQAAEAIAEGFQIEIPQVSCDCIPLADGGEGTAKTLTNVLGGVMKYTQVENAYGKKVRASFGWVERLKYAFVDSASAIGLEQVPSNKRNPMQNSSYGLGQLIKAAHRRGAKKLLIGLGGTATVDGGIGMAQALGVKIFDDKKTEVLRGGRALSSIHTIDASNMYSFDSCQIVVAVDVKNPLLGKNGAAHIFGPQKGADATGVKILEKGMKNFAEKVYTQIIKNKKLSFDKAVNFSGSGAAGGLGMAIPVFCGAKVQSGIEIVLDFCHFDKRVKNADLVITGEGQLDGQSINGKVPFGVLYAAKKLNVPVIIIAGALKKNADAMYKHGALAVFSSTLRSDTWENIKKNARQNLVFTARSIARLWKGSIAQRK